MNGEKLSLGWSYTSVTMPSCLQTDLSEFSEGKGSEAFASNHSRIEKEVLGFSYLGAESSTPFSSPRTQVAALVLCTMLCDLGEPSP